MFNNNLTPANTPYIQWQLQNLIEHYVYSCINVQLKIQYIITTNNIYTKYNLLLLKRSDYHFYEQKHFNKLPISHEINYTCGMTFGQSIDQK